jgi:hypothetical protein
MGKRQFPQDMTVRVLVTISIEHRGNPDRTRSEVVDQVRRALDRAYPVDAPGVIDWEALPVKDGPNKILHVTNDGNDGLDMTRLDPTNIIAATGGWVADAQALATKWLDTAIPGDYLVYQDDLLVLVACEGNEGNQIVSTMRTFCERKPLAP